MVVLYAFSLACDNCHDISRQILLASLVVCVQQCVLTTLALGKHALCAVTCQGATHRDPATMQGTYYRTALFNFSTHFPDEYLKLRGMDLRLLRVSLEQLCKVFGFAIPGAFPKAVFAIAASFKQFIQGIENVPVNYRGIRAIRFFQRCKTSCSLGIGPLPRCESRCPGLLPRQKRAVFLCFPMGRQTTFRFIKRTAVFRAAISAQAIGRCIVIKRTTHFVIRLLAVSTCPIRFLRSGIDRFSGSLATKATRESTCYSAHQRAGRPTKGTCHGTCSCPTQSGPYTGSHRMGARLLCQRVQIEIVFLCHVRLLEWINEVKNTHWTSAAPPCTQKKYFRDRISLWSLASRPGPVRQGQSIL